MYDNDDVFACSLVVGNSHCLPCINDILVVWCIVSPNLMDVTGLSVIYMGVLGSKITP